MKDYPVDKKVTGKIIEIRSNGAVLDLGEGMQGTIKKDKIPPTMTLKTGDSIDAVVSNVDTKRRRLELTPVLKEKPLTYR